MRTGKDWSSIIAKVQELPPPSTKTSEPFLGAEGGEASCFILQAAGWKEMPLDIFYGSNIKSLCNSNWALKVISSHGTHYYCGSDDVYAKLDGKERLFIHDLADRLWTSLQRYEMKAADFFSHSLGHLIKVEMACRILGANVQ